MALREKSLAVVLLVTAYTASFVFSFHNCVPENVYSISCLNRTDALPADAELCATSLTYGVLDSKAGMFAFSLLLPFNEPNTSTDITILSLQSSDGIECSPEVEGVHSKFTLVVDGSGLNEQNKPSDKVSCQPNQVKKVEWKSSYMFTGCYRIDLSLNYDCRSKPFRIKSDFIKDIFADLRLRLLTTFVGNNVRLAISSDQLINDCNNPIHPSPCLCLSLYKDRSDGQDSSTWKWEHMVYANRPMEKNPKDGDSVSHCHWFREEHGELVDCSCTWTEESLECTFIDVPPGNYSIELDIMDTRCNRDTIWTKGWEKLEEEPCLWKHDGIVVKNNTRSHFWPFDVPAVQSFSSPWLIAIVAMTAAAIGLSVYFRWRRRSRLPIIPRSWQDTGEAIDVHEKLLDPPKVLLLYARDCRPFMSVMATLRRLLRENISAQVYDMWEDRTQEQIDSQGDIWTSKYLHTENVRVILVATPISRRIEVGLMNGLEIEYGLPDSRDETFLFALKTAISLVPKIKDPCNKFIIVRLHHKNCSEDILQNFSNNSTVYTLPTHFQKLIFHLLQSQSVNVALNLKNTELLCDKIDVYEKFISSHPAYDSEMLNSLESDK